MKQTLSEREEAEILSLVNAANAADHTEYTAPLDADVWYLSRSGGRIISVLAVYAMGDTVGGRPVEELMLFTEPGFRGHGRARRLLKKYRKSLAVPEPVLRFSAYASAPARGYLAHCGARHDHDELLMSRQFSAGGRELGEQERVFRNDYSECSVKTWGSVGYLYGVRTDSSHLRQGSAEKLLKEVLAKLSGQGAGSAVLEVSSANLPACALYRKLGFEVDQCLEIWVLEPEALNL